MAQEIKKLEEKVLLQQLREGSHLAYMLLYNRYKKIIAYKLLRLLKSEELAQDVLQDIFLKIWEKRDYINAEFSFPAFLHRLVRNEVSDIIRKANQDKRLQQQLLISTPIDYTHIEELITRNENIVLLQEALKQLPERQREVFLMHKIEQKSYKEISENLKISPAAINQHVYRAMQHLARILNPTVCALMMVCDCNTFFF
ncbi:MULTISPECIES: RNA polymerase sigma factor [unclassified Sphingobacterium]|uniref:RNA polymerase sigma factor n=1 Tax=unclassified Sphingobacterium TaxID=2609468 RepID=UPI0010475B92|nr:MULTISPECIES: RNA polymerase sigma factor [unclassified Sphingobacterium]MCS3556130.1 RNA polymerase sigma-70 factor (ECF subfamily) [Sphingobacterium sp. JUb21]TCR08506.1 RNA polymerase sigma-70 factor (ECF subfamily) [Sphingobacterium sp. JUb20]